MGIIHLELSADLQALIDRQIAEGRVSDAQSFLTEAVQRYADELHRESGITASLDDIAYEEEIAEIARRGIADLEAGRFVTIRSQRDAEAWMADVMTDIRPNLSES